MVNIVNELYNLNLTEEQIPLTDAKTWEMISNGKTLGVFQFESPIGINTVKKIKPKNIEELAAGNAFIRPGASGLDEYVKGKNNEGYSRKIDPKLDKYLDNTYGSIVFQEQIMELIAELMGVSFGQADIYRRALEKPNKGKNKKIVEEFNNTVVEKATKLGFSEKVADEVRRLIIENSGYGFNKCLSGDEKIYGYDLTIKELYQKYLMYKDKTIEVNPLQQTMSMNYKKDFNWNLMYPVKNQIKSIQYSGLKHTYKITLESSRTIKATLNHKFPIVDNGIIKEKLLEDIQINDYLIVYNKNDNTFTRDKIIDIKIQPIEEVYDITMEDPEHNFFIDNGILTCNSHAVCYSVISYQTAWFKCNYPLVFYTVMLNSCNEHDFPLFMNEAKSRGITILPPNVNKSKYKCTIEDKNNQEIRIGLKSIKGVGPAAVKCIEEYQPFNSLDEFFEKKTSSVNKGTIEALSNIGAFLNLGINIEEDDVKYFDKSYIKDNKLYLNKEQYKLFFKKYFELSTTKSIPKYAIPTKIIKGKILNKFDLFVEKDINAIIVPEDKLDLLELSLSEEDKIKYKTRKTAKGMFKLEVDNTINKLPIFRRIINLYHQEFIGIEEKPIENYINEIEVLGYSFMEHPCQKFINKIYDQKDPKSTFESMNDNAIFMTCGVIKGLEEKLTKNNKKYYIITIISPVDIVKLSLWDNQYLNYKDMIKQNNIIKVLGTKKFGRLQVDKMGLIK